MSYFYNWFGTEEKEIVIPDSYKQNKFQVLKEIKLFDKSILLPTYKPVIEVKPKICKYKKTKRRKRNR
jgi:hypothetical protein